jgi:hypothetical protein
VSAMPETLQQLVRRRLHEMGISRGRDGSLSLREAYLAVEGAEVSYEVVRRVEKGGHTNIGAGAVRTIATMLDVAENDVRLAAGQKPDLGPFRLPSRANRLERPERDVVLSVIDAILAAGQREARTPLRAVPTAAMEDEPRGRQPERERPGENTDPYIDGP